MRILGSCEADVEARNRVIVESMRKPEMVVLGFLAKNLRRRTLQKYFQ